MGKKLPETCGVLFQVLSISRNGVGGEVILLWTFAIPFGTHDQN